MVTAALSVTLSLIKADYWLLNVSAVSLSSMPNLLNLLIVPNAVFVCNVVNAKCPVIATSVTTHGDGCTKCNFKSYKGRLLVAEIFTLDTQAQLMITQQKSALESTAVTMRDYLCAFDFNNIK
jgi:hypothetical protein